MLARLYTILISPRQTDRDMRNREIVLNVLYVSTLALLTLGLLLMTIVALSGHYVVYQACGVALADLFVFIMYLASRRGHFGAAASALIGVYCLLATAIAFHWGVILPTAPLLYGLIIILAGILFGPAYSVYFAAGITSLLIALQIAGEQGVIHPDWSWLATPPDLFDVVSLALIFGALSLVSWLFNHQMERSLKLAIQAEQALTEQKALLETTVAKRTRELQEMQLEKVQHMYRFAELGQLSTALLHDLANHLATLTIDIEGLEGQTRSRALSRIKRSIRYIDDMVVRVRDQLHGRNTSRRFIIANEIDAVVQMLNHRAHIAHVTLEWKPPVPEKPIKCHGEPIRFRQMMANLISNGIDAYADKPTDSPNRTVRISAKEQENNVVITVEDWGYGISGHDRTQLFEPFFSTKSAGMGMGLYIVRQIAEEHFVGSVRLDDNRGHTIFVITLPKAQP